MRWFAGPRARLHLLLRGRAANFAVLIAYVSIMMLVCMLAWIVPTRRALSIAPSEALRWD